MVLDRSDLIKTTHTMGRSKEIKCILIVFTSLRPQTPCEDQKRLRMVFDRFDFTKTTHTMEGSKGIKGGSWSPFSHLYHLSCAEDIYLFI